MRSINIRRDAGRTIFRNALLRCRSIKLQTRYLARLFALLPHHEALCWICCSCVSYTWSRRSDYQHSVSKLLKNDIVKFVVFTITFSSGVTECRMKLCRFLVTAILTTSCSCRAPAPAMEWWNFSLLHFSHSWYVFAQSQQRRLLTFLNRGRRLCQRGRWSLSFGNQLVDNDKSLKALMQRTPRN